MNIVESHLLYQASDVITRAIYRAFIALAGIAKTTYVKSVELIMPRRNYEGGSSVSFGHRSTIL